MTAFTENSFDSLLN